MLAPTLAGNNPRTRAAQRVAARSRAVDVVIFLVFAGFAAAYLFEGGLETLIGAAVGAAIGLRNAHWRNARVTGAISGAFSGLFAGALFAGFFHGALVALPSLIF